MSGPAAATAYKTLDLSKLELPLETYADLSRYFQSYFRNPGASGCVEALKTGLSRDYYHHRLKPGEQKLILDIGGGGPSILLASGDTKGGTEVKVLLDCKHDEILTQEDAASKSQTSAIRYFANLFTKIKHQVNSGALVSCTVIWSNSVSHEPRPSSSRITGNLTTIGNTDFPKNEPFRHELKPGVNLDELILGGMTLGGICTDNLSRLATVNDTTALLGCHSQARYAVVNCTGSNSCDIANGNHESGHNCILPMQFERWSIHEALGSRYVGVPLSIEEVISGMGVVASFNAAAKDSFLSNGTGTAQLELLRALQGDNLLAPQTISAWANGRNIEYHTFNDIARALGAERVEKLVAPLKEIAYANDVRSASLAAAWIVAVASPSLAKGAPATLVLDSSQCRYSSPYEYNLLQMITKIARECGFNPYALEIVRVDPVKSGEFEISAPMQGAMGIG